jgi:hypothetical protein
MADYGLGSSDLTQGAISGCFEKGNKLSNYIIVNELISW